MGARSQNFHLNLMDRMGFGDAARHVQDLFFEGRRGEAVAAIPDELADEIALVGPKERIRDRLSRWRGTPVSTMIVGSPDPAVMRLMAELAL